ncbi:MAG: L-histidine N(alpha)-methyltransferase [Bacteroidales bacterium]
MSGIINQHKVFDHSSSAEFDQITITNLLESENNSIIIADIFSGLTAEKKYISSKYFYDKTGSKLFEGITRLPEYYPTRTEKSILSRVAPDIIAFHGTPQIIELGSGDCSKICILLDAFQEGGFESISYYPVDVSKAAVIQSSEELIDKYPGLRVHGIVADFMKHLDALPDGSNRLICFFGSTLGNLGEKEATDFICRVKHFMKKGDSFLLGLDIVKDVRTLELAYNDNQGITDAFNKNILSVVNNLATTNLHPEDFKHSAFFNSERSRIEMHLVALKDLVIESPHFSKKITLKKGETIHTENSRKFTKEDIRQLANDSGLSIKGIHTDDNEWFSLVHFICTG